MDLDNPGVDPDDKVTAVMAYLNSAGPSNKRRRGGGGAIPIDTLLTTESEEHDPPVRRKKKAALGSNRGEDVLSQRGGFDPGYYTLRNQPLSLRLLASPLFVKLLGLIYKSH